MFNVEFSYEYLGETVYDKMQIKFIGSPVYLAEIHLSKKVIICVSMSKNEANLTELARYKKVIKEVLSVVYKEQVENINIHSCLTKN